MFFKRAIFSLILTVTIAWFANTVFAQSTYSVNINDAGNGQSRISWSWAGDVASLSGATWDAFTGYFGGFDIGNRSAFAVDSPFLTQGTNFDILGGGMFVNPDICQSAQISMLNLGMITYPGDFKYLSILLMAPPGVPMTAGEHFAYVAGNDSLVIPVVFSNFNAGILQNTFTGPFTTSVTVVLTIGQVPEPSIVALAGFGMVGLLVCKRFKT